MFYSDSLWSVPCERRATAGRWHALCASAQRWGIVAAVLMGPLARACVSPAQTLSLALPSDSGSLLGAIGNPAYDAEAAANTLVNRACVRGQSGARAVVDRALWPFVVHFCWAYATQQGVHTKSVKMPLLCNYIRNVNRTPASTVACAQRPDIAARAGWTKNKNA